MNSEQSQAVQSLPLSYCANVHPGETRPEVLSNLDRFVRPLAASMDRPISVGLWLASKAVDEWAADPSRVRELADKLSQASVTTYTFNTFPFGNFHATTVKEEVYRPDWTQSRRADYTVRAANVLSELLPVGAQGSLSTVPLAFARHHDPHADTSIYQPLIIQVARDLRSLKDQTGKTIRLAIEPEPGCVLETTEQVIAFFESLWRTTDGTDDEPAVREHLGICYDVCHQAVEFEPIAGSMRRLDAAGIQIVKLHLSCALELADPDDEEARQQLLSFVEPRYLHQTFGRHPSGRIMTQMDLTREHLLAPSPEWLDGTCWRVHFHVPIHLESLGKLQTTRPQLIEAIQTIPKLTHPPHLEVETYTWGVLPTDAGGQVGDERILHGLKAELDSAWSLIQDACG